jgi:hypothetical protein
LFSFILLLGRFIYKFTLLIKFPTLKTIDIHNELHRTKNKNKICIQIDNNKGNLLTLTLCGV